MLTHWIRAESKKNVLNKTRKLFNCSVKSEAASWKIHCRIGIIKDCRALTAQRKHIEIAPTQRRGEAAANKFRIKFIETRQKVIFARIVFKRWNEIEEEMFSVRECESIYSNVCVCDLFFHAKFRFIGVKLSYLLLHSSARNESLSFRRTESESREVFRRLLDKRETKWRNIILLATVDLFVSSVRLSKELLLFRFDRNKKLGASLGLSGSELFWCLPILYVFLPALIFSHLLRPRLATSATPSPSRNQHSCDLFWVLESVCPPHTHTRARASQSNKHQPHSEQYRSGSEDDSFLLFPFYVSSQIFVHSVRTVFVCLFYLLNVVWTHFYTK